MEGKDSAACGAIQSNGVQMRKRKSSDNIANGEGNKKPFVSSPESSSAQSDKEFTADIVFALDYSANVSQEDIAKQLDFVECLASSLNVAPGKSRAAVITYGDSAITRIRFDPHNPKPFAVRGLLNRETVGSESGRISLALEEAASAFQVVESENVSTLNGNEHKKLLFLITAESERDGTELEACIAQSEHLNARNVQTMIAPVGSQIDFRVLGQMVKRPQCVFPLLSFGDMTASKAKDIEVGVKIALDIVGYAKKKAQAFSGISPEHELWEKISHLSLVMEGTWYLLYQEDDTGSKKSKTEMKKVEKLISESIDNFHSKLTSENSINLTVAVLGLQGVGKSYMLNFLLNYGLADNVKMTDGPLPSGPGGSQTPVPVRLKYGNKVQVSLRHKKVVHEKPDVWYSNDDLGPNTLASVNNIMKEKFKDVTALDDAAFVEFQGPFPIFQYLKERKCSNSGHLVLDVDVVFEDLPGLGDKDGDDKIDVHLSKADLIFFFAGGHAGRPVSSEDLSTIFRMHDEFEYVLRPKLVLIDNPGRDSVTAPDSYLREGDREAFFRALYKEQRENLNRAWSTLLSTEDGNNSQRYKKVKEKLPQLGGEDLLERLQKESEVIVFHPNNPDFLNALKDVIDNHINTVRTKNKFHPFLKKLHWAAKKLKTQLNKSCASVKKVAQRVEEVNVNVRDPVFEIYYDTGDANILVESFLAEKIVLFDGDAENLGTICDEFLRSEETLKFVLTSVEDSLGLFSKKLITAVEDAYSAASREVSEDHRELAEMLSEGRILSYCTVKARDYVCQVIDKCKNRVSIKKQKKKWTRYDEEGRKYLCTEFLQDLLEKMLNTVQQSPRTLQRSKHSILPLVECLKSDVKELFRVVRPAGRLPLLNFLSKNTSVVIDVCREEIRNVNPHPSFESTLLDHTTLPDQFREGGSYERQDTERQDTENQDTENHKRIIEEVTKILKFPKKKADPVRRLEQLLKLKKNALVLREPHNVENRTLWPLALIKILSDENHFAVDLDPALVQEVDSQNTAVCSLMRQAVERLFAHQVSRASCCIVEDQSLSENEMHLVKSEVRMTASTCLEVRMTASMQKDLETMRMTFVDPTNTLAPIFIPTIHPGPQSNIMGNYYLEEDPWSATEEGDEGDESVQEGTLDFNIFLVVEKQHLEDLKRTIAMKLVPKDRKIKLKYVVLPQNGRGIGVTRSIIKILAECLSFRLYWTIDDDIKQMYEFNENDRRWHKCTFGRGLLFGQRVYQECLKKTVNPLSSDQRDELWDEFDEDWPLWAKKTKNAARSLLLNDKSFEEVKMNVGRLDSPFTMEKVSIDCGEDEERKEPMRRLQQKFVDRCKEKMFLGNINRIAGVALAHESTKRYDYMAKYPSEHYMRSKQRYQVVLNNASALQGMNFVTDDIIFDDEEFQVKDKDKRNNPHWGVRGSNRSFTRALAVRGVIGYQVICITHSHQKLTNVFERVGPSYIGSQSPYRADVEEGSEDESEAS